MFSQRLPWNSHSNAIAQELTHLRSVGKHIMDLTESNPTRASITYPNQRILEAFENPRMLLYDPDSAGLRSARDCIAETFQLNPATLILTSSTSEAYSWLFKLLCDPGDQVLVPRPSYPLFEYLSALESVTAGHYPLRYAGVWSIDLRALEESITNRTRAIVIVNPNHPTGSYVAPHELEALSDICARHDLALISDEVFASYSFDAARRFVPAATLLPTPAFSLNGLSKLVGMPQMKLAWIQTNHADAHRRLELIADTYLSVGTPVQYALPALLTARVEVQAQIQSRLNQNLAALQARFRPRTVEGGWFAVLQVPRTLSEEAWAITLLREEGVLIQPGFFYDFDSEAFLVLGLLTQPDDFREGLERIGRTIDRFA